MSEFMPAQHFVSRDGEILGKHLKLKAAFMSERFGMRGTVAALEP